MANELTTAQLLTAYRRELVAGSFERGVIDDLVRDAAQTIVMNEGLRVTHDGRHVQQPVPPTE
ncbi:hypothetical protein ACFV0R_19025 [Streptomyces sp. NPDC059578]|uniref:hypothetical protein n=1 Tax=Streptomyces sp. NPDC059578 TaxID=3346874 RepID=UPI0036C692A9